MKRKLSAAAVIVFLAAIWLIPSGGEAQMRGRGQRGGMRHQQQVTIPEKLPAPKSREWIDQLQEVYVSEVYSQVQYEADFRKYRTHRPYHMIIPQEQNHIDWIRRMLTAYGLTPSEKRLPVVETNTLEEAYALGKKLEADLVPRYERLIQNAEDSTARQTLDVILLETRHHYVMFDHVGWMGGPGRGGHGRGGMRGC